MNIRFYFRLFVPFLLCSIILGSSTVNGEKHKIKNTATGRGGGVQNIKPNTNNPHASKMQETPSPAAGADLEGKGKHRKTPPNVVHHIQAIETNQVKVNKEHGLVSSSNCRVFKVHCCKRVCQKRRPQQAQFPHNSGAHHPRSNHHSSVIRVQRQADICAACGVGLDANGDCDCPDDAWQHDSEGEEVEQPPPQQPSPPATPPESDSLPEQVVPDINYDSDSDQVVPDYYAGDAVVPDS